jgi:hypothetical protein
MALNYKECSCSVNPISSLEALLAFDPADVDSALCPIPHRHKPLPLSKAFSDREPKVGLDGEVVGVGNERKRSKLILCHDFKGGYLDDRSLENP